MVKRLFIEAGHPAHINLAQTICERRFKPDKKWKKIFVPWNYDIYFIEGSLFPVVTLWFYKRILGKKLKIFNIFADPRLYSLKSKSYFNEKKGVRMKYPKIKSWFIKKLIGFIDGYVYIGNYQRELFEKIQGLNKNKPYIIAYPCMNENRYNELKEINPNLNSKNIVFIGGYELATELEYKGYDIMFEVFPELKKIDSKINLTIIGGGWLEKNKIKDVIFAGQVNDISKELKKSSLYLHLGLGDSFPVTALECMRAGIPVIVSDQVGIKEIVSRIKPDFVVDRKNPEKIKDTITEYFRLNLKEKEKLSKSFRKESEFFSPEKCALDFKRKFLEMEKKSK